jgi:hypothetical protein
VEPAAGSSWPRAVGGEVIRNGPDSREVLSREQSIESGPSMWALSTHVEFRLLHMIVEGELLHHSSTGRHPDCPGGAADAIASIEVFRVVDGPHRRGVEQQP